MLVGELMKRFKSREYSLGPPVGQRDLSRNLKRLQPLILTTNIK
jgi:hypothetical protein